MFRATLNVQISPLILQFHCNLPTAGCKTLQNHEGNLKNKQPATLLDALLCFIQLNSILLNSFLLYATLVYSTPLHSTLLVFKNLPAKLLKLYSTPLNSTCLQEPAG